MTPRLKVLIIDPDQFFAVGLTKLLTAHFHAKGIALRFMNNPLSYPMADLIFWAPGYSGSQIPRGLLTERYLSSRLFIVTSGDKTPLTNRILQRVFNRRQSCTVLLALVDEALSKKVPYSHPELAAGFNSVDLLTPRQQEVMYYVSKGMRVNKIADNMQLHEKTVSSHKRAAMDKLRLKRTTELHDWLINNPITRTSA